MAEPERGDCRRVKPTPHEARTSFSPDPREPPGTDPYAGGVGAGKGNLPGDPIRLEWLQCLLFRLPTAMFLFGGAFQPAQRISGPCREFTAEQKAQKSASPTAW